MQRAFRERVQEQTRQSPHMYRQATVNLRPDSNIAPDQTQPRPDAPQPNSRISYNVIDLRQLRPADSETRIREARNSDSGHTSTSHNDAITDAITQMSGALPQSSGAPRAERLELETSNAEPWPSTSSNGTDNSREQQRQNELRQRIRTSYIESQPRLLPLTRHVVASPPLAQWFARPLTSGLRYPIAMFDWAPGRRRNPLNPRNDRGSIWVDLDRCTALGLNRQQVDYIVRTEILYAVELAQISRSAGADFWERWRRGGVE